MNTLLYSYKTLLTFANLALKPSRSRLLKSFPVFKSISLSKQNIHRAFYAASHSLSNRMSSVTVKNFENDERLHIHLQLTMPQISPADNGASSSSSVKFTLSRLKTEELKLAIDRLRLNLNKKQSKKYKKKVKKVDAEASISNQIDDSLSDSLIPIEILHNGSVLDEKVQNEMAWIDGALLKVGDETIPINYNEPCVKLDKLPATILEGCPLYPGSQIDFTTQDQCQFFWKAFDEKDIHKIKMQISRENVDLEGTTSSDSFTPQPNDVGKYVLLVCVPQRGNIKGKSDAVVSQSLVTKGPGLCPFEIRQELTISYSEHQSFRVMTYNLLAEVYSETEVAQNQLFHYCPPEYLTMDYRKHLLLKEIIGYKADLLCLQEVDKHIFTSHLNPALSALGYTGLFMQKTNCSEGCASFFRQEKFRVINSYDIVLSEYLSGDPVCADIWEEVSKVEPLRERIIDRSSVLLVTVLESIEKPGHLVCLCNTHLYFHPTACNIRLLLAAAALRHIQAVCDAYTQEGKTTAMVFCGDFNSAPHLGVYQLMTSQMVPRDHADWSSGETEQLLTTLDLHQPMNIKSACGTPPYTNYTAGFQATLDYIFIDDDRLEITEVVPLPSDEEVKANVAIPSRVFPSDHLALVCDLKFS